MGNHDRSRPPRWLGLLLMASVAVAQTAQASSGLTLSNFQLITSTGVPLACILTYNTVLPSCQTTDFTQGNTCSTACVNGVRSVQRAVQTACDQVSAASNSLLGQALEGNLAEVLCPASAPPSRTEILATDIPTLSPPGSPAGSPSPPPPVQTETGSQQQPTNGPEPDVALGGGSPFDVVTTGASSRLSSTPIAACLVGLALSLLLTR
ncbi:hypothetical protein B0T16DRAFT_164371 [Cercophora newfieldiana]|uniref:Uncharacterized protein n=1 Tax=Cercophora newfieldiana TaxID=92897 RepID=A0AA40CQ49_9PEZI|nr:hypothetical protein B0T16DRAFT_164371 [Cercophora newfieldiana]